MKKSTGIVFLVALVLAAVAYFYDWKKHPSAPEDNPNDVKLAFDIKPDDEVNAITLTRQGTTMNFVLKEDGWYLTAPVAMRANQSVVADLAHDFGTVIEDRTIPATADNLKEYGLVNPTADMTFKTRNGGTHRLRIGNGDFSNLEVYSQVDNDDKNVVLIAKNAAEGSNHPLEDFRDHSVLSFTYFEATSFDLHNASGEVAGKKDGDNWNIVKPVETPGASDAVAKLLQTVMDAKLSKFVDDNAKDAPAATLAKYGLQSPVARLSVTAGGSTAELLMGKKEGAGYYAMDTARGMIFEAPASLMDTLGMKLTDLESKVLFTGSEVDVAQLELRGPAGTTSCVKDSTGSMVLEQPAGQGASSQAPDCPDFLTPLETAKAQKVDNQPADSIRAKFTKPAVVVTLTTNPAPPAAPVAPASSNSPPSAQKQIKIQISAPTGTTVYAKSSVSPIVYEFNKSDLDVLFAKTDAPTATAPAPTGQDKDSGTNKK